MDGSEPAEHFKRLIIHSINLSDEKNFNWMNCYLVDAVRMHNAFKSIKEDKQKINLEVQKLDVDAQIAGFEVKEINVDKNIANNRGFSQNIASRILSRQGYKCNNSPGSKFREQYNYSCLLHESESPSRERGMFDHSGYQLDHIIPVSKGGMSTLENGQALCPNCYMVKTRDESENKRMLDNDCVT